MAVADQMESLIDSYIDVSFGYIDVDQFPDHAREINLINVPACSYYVGSRLVATVVGMHQDIASNIVIVRSGGIPATSNKISRA